MALGGRTPVSAELGAGQAPRASFNTVEKNPDSSLFAQLVLQSLHRQQVLHILFNLQNGVKSGLLVL
jgi:hypothetical protein